MNTREFDALRLDTLHHAVAARNFAESLNSDPKAARVWHALADRLHEAAEQCESMDRVVTPVRP